MDVNGTRFHLLLNKDDWTVSSTCLFRWNEIPGNDNGKLTEFLKQKFRIDWAKTVEIEKIDNGNTIKVSTEINHLSLNLNKEKTEVIFKIDDVRTDKFIAKIENGKLNIYSSTITVSGSPPEPDLVWNEKSSHLRLESLLFHFTKPPGCLFSWDNIPGNDNLRLIEFLKQNFGIDWVKTAKIEKIDNGKTIKVSTQKNYLLLKLNNEQTEVNLEIDDVRTDKFVVKIENSKLNIYPPGEPYFRPERRRGAARDQYANWYWIDEKQREIRFLAMNSDQSEHFWSSDDMGEACVQDYHRDFKPMHTATPPILKLGALAVTTHHYLVVGVVDPAGILVFDLYAGGQPVYMHWPELKPFDMAPALDGGVWILDRENKCYWRLDRYFRVVTFHQGEKLNTCADFQPKNGSQTEIKARSLQTGISLKMASPLKSEHPLAIEALSDDTILILDSNPDLSYSEVHRYCSGEHVGTESPGRKLGLNLDIEDDNSDMYSLHGYDIAFVNHGKNENNRVTGTLYIIGSDGNQAYAFTFVDHGVDFVDHGVTFSLDLQPRYFPLRLFSGKALVSDGTTVYYDLQDRWLPVIEQSRPRFKEQGVLTTRVFDGKDIDCVWHRLFLDASIPPGAEVIVESRAANRKEFLVQMPWRTEPGLYRRGDGAELPYYQPFTLEEARQEGTGTWELLLQHGQGRYLELQVTIRGTGRNTPWLRALRVYYPRFSYLNEYLPAVYQDDTKSALFLERFLANMEGIYSVIEGNIEQVQTMFDVCTIQSEYLDWLAGWFGVILDPAWDENRRRLFLSHIMQLFSERGTPAGLSHAIRLSTDPCPDDTLFEQDAGWEVHGKGLSGHIVRHSVRIIERYLTRSTPGVVYGDPSQIEGPGVTTDIEKWTPAHGAEYIHEQFRAYLEYRYRENDEPIEALNIAWNQEYKSFDEILFPPVLPQNPAIREDWTRFTQKWLGFTYAAVVPDDKAAYQAFLMRRDQLNVVSYSGIELPDVLPSGGKQLNDWIQFVSMVLPINRNAHHFTVLVPTDPEDDIGMQKRQFDLVRRIVELEKPAHTEFDVKQYWDLFRVGEARLGLDTQLSRGSRYVSLVLGKSSLMESFLGTSRENVHERIVIGEN